MTRRPLLAAAALCATLTLAACNGSPNAGQPNTAPTPSTPTSTPTSAPSTPTWTEEEQAAINAANARYIAARAAIDQAMHDPRKSPREALVKAGNGGSWLISVLGEIDFQRDNGWYQVGNVQVASSTVVSVKLTGEQPEVRLDTCIDSSKISTKFQASGKPVPTGSDDGNRHKGQARLVFAPPTDGGAKMWFLIEEKGAGKC